MAPLGTPMTERTLANSRSQTPPQRAGCGPDLSCTI